MVIKFIWPSLNMFLGLILSRRMDKAQEVLQSTGQILEGLLVLDRGADEPYTVQYFQQQLCLQEEYYRTKVM